MALSYSLVTSYAGDALIAGFDFYNDTDDIHNGFVQYQARDDAAAANLWSVNQLTNSVVLAVDSLNEFDVGGAGRPSVRVESRDEFNHGLFVADFAHMPPSQCGVWPSFLALGSKWPDNGEVDIIEGANTAQRNLISAHTGPNCVLTQQPTLGSLQNAQCGPGAFNVGCSYAAPPDKHSYGDSFNAIGGGVYAMEWTPSAIKVWNFPRGRIPSDITSKSPQPDTWGSPDAIFGGSGCDVDSHFRDMRLVLDVNFCGDYAASTWADDPVCSARGPSCAAFVAASPAAFSETFWEVNHIDAYALMDAASSSSLKIEEQESTTTTTTTSHSTRTVTLLHPRASVPGVVAIEKYPIFLNSSSSSASSSHSISTHTSQPTSSASASASATAPPSPHGMEVTNLARIGNYSFFGCIESLDGFIGFKQSVANTTAMTPSRCIASCNGKKYAGVFDQTCYCADALSGDIKALADASDCDIPCPGNHLFACGGYSCIDSDDDPPTTHNNSTLRLLRRDASPDILLTMYALLVDEPEPAPAPGFGGPAGVERVTVTSTVTYTTLCPTDASALVPTVYVAVVTADCSYGEKPPVPMITEVVSCHGCGHGGQDSVTLTVPAGAPGAAAPGQTTAPSVVPGIVPDVRIAGATSVSAGSLPLWMVAGVGAISFVLAVFL